jgi:FixJ family two-component response regulator
MKGLRALVRDQRSEQLGIPFGCPLRQDGSARPAGSRRENAASLSRNVVQLRPVDRIAWRAGVTSPPATIFLLDDEPGTVRARSRLLRMAGHEVRAFPSSHDFLADYDPAIPGCAVLNFAMPGLNGLELQAALAASGKQPPIVFISRSADIFSSVQAMKRGAVDFLAEPIDKRELLAAVRCAIERDRQMRQIWTELRSIGGRLATLTPRELEVFHHIVAGRRNKQIAADLGTVEKTIKVHRSSIMKKMNASSLPDLVRMAVQTERAGQGYTTGRSAGWA